MLEDFSHATSCSALVGCEGLETSHHPAHVSFTSNIELQCGRTQKSCTCVLHDLTDVHLLQR
jgi:hypothetical protein